MYELETLEEYLKKIHPESIHEKTLKEHTFYVNNEKERICNYFRNLSFQNHPDSVLDKIVSAHQLGIFDICNAIIVYEQESIVAQELILFYKSVRKRISEIVEFIHLHFPSNFNLDLPTTSIIAEAERDNFKERLKNLTDLYNHSQLEKPLFRLALHPLTEFVDVENRKSPTYRELEYLKQLSASLSSLLLLEEKSDINYELHSLLLHLNYNYPRYVLYCTYRLDEKLMQLSTKDERLEKITWYLRTMEQLELRPGLSYMRGIPSVTQQIHFSIQNAYQHILKQDNLDIINERAERAKIRLSVSVAVLALFIKILIRGGIIVNQNNAEVFRVIVENFATLKSEQLSFESIKGKFNKTPLSAYGSIKRMFFKLSQAFKNI